MKQIKVKGLPTIDMVEVKGGVFHYGPEIGKVKQEDTYPGELDPEMSINDFCIAKTQVTEELWDAVMGNESNMSQFPVRNVSWNACQTFIAKLNEMSGHKFRLAYEPEWEYAARGGNKSQGYLYSGSNDAEDVAIFSTDNKKLTTPSKVASLQANELGLYDMSGNVWEWCENWFENRMEALQYYIHAFKPQIIATLESMIKSEKDSQKKSAIINAIEFVKTKSAWIGQTEFKTYRGGGFDTNMKCSRPYTYVPGKKDFTRPSLGLRLAMDAESVTEPKREHILLVIRMLVDGTVVPIITDNPTPPISGGDNQEPPKSDPKLEKSKKDLKALIERVNGIIRTTEPVPAGLKEANDKANKVLKQSNSSDEIISAIFALQSAIDKEKEDIKEELNKLIEQANGIIRTTEPVPADLKEANNKANEILNLGNSSEEMKSAIHALQIAIDKVK